ncbi:endoribonuclease l-PSP domain-containing protein [Sarocladium implicatum]|nr:endoribonuclease l-PSP domain-containing protein [Sarocladium implicatum]
MSAQKQPIYASDALVLRPGVYTPAIVANGLVFVSGILGADPVTKKMVEGTVVDRFHQIMRNLAAVLERAGSSVQSVVDVAVFLDNIDNADVLTPPYLEYWGDVKPARTCVAVKDLPYGSDVELKCVALCDQERPRCKLCQKLGQKCNYGYQTLQFRTVVPVTTSGPSSSSTQSATYAPEDLEHEADHTGGSESETWASLPPGNPTFIDWNTASTRLDSGHSGYYPISLEKTNASAHWHSLTLSAASLQAAAARINSDNSLFNTDDLLFFPLPPLSPLSELIEPSDSSASRRSRQLTPTTSIHHDAGLGLSNDPNPSSQYESYEKAWRDLCVRALPPILKYVVDITLLPPVISWSALALSASRLSRVQPQREVDPSNNKVQFRPSRVHWIASQQFYCSAIREVASWRPADKRQDVGTMIQAMLLLCCLESTTGNFDVFQLHSEGIQSLIMSGIEAILAVDRAGGIRLLQAWAQTKMHSWWRRSHFSTVRFALRDVSFRIEPRLHAYLTVENTRRTSVLASLCESYRLSVASYVYQLEKADLSDSGIVPEDLGASSDPFLSEALTQTFDELSKQSWVLDAWVSHRAKSDLPIDISSATAEPVHPLPAGIKVEPLLFNSHAASMNYAYYITARIIQAASGVKSMPFSKLPTDNKSHDETEYWSRQLLRVAAGIRWTDCLAQNPFSIGLSGLMLACSLRCSNPDICSWIQSWIELHCKDETAEEGCFPVWQVWQCVCLVNEERAKGYEVVAVFQPSENEVRQGKHDSYQNQSLASVRLVVRNRTDDKYELKHVTMYSDKQHIDSSPRVSG